MENRNLKKLKITDIVLTSIIYVTIAVILCVMDIANGKIYYGMFRIETIAHYVVFAYTFVLVGQWISTKFVKKKTVRTYYLWMIILEIIKVFCVAILSYVFVLLALALNIFSYLMILIAITTIVLDILLFIFSIKENKKKEILQIQ